MGHIEVTVNLDKHNGYLRLLEFAGKTFSESELKQLNALIARHEIITITLKGKDEPLY